MGSLLRRLGLSLTHMRWSAPDLLRPVLLCSLSDFVQKPASDFETLVHEHDSMSDAVLMIVAQDPKQFVRMGPTGEPYLRHRQDLRDATGQPACTRALPYGRPAQAKPRMPRRAAGVLVSSPAGMQSSTVPHRQTHPLPDWHA